MQRVQYNKNSPSPQGAPCAAKRAAPAKHVRGHRGAGHMRAGRPASVRALRGYAYTGQPPGKKHRRQHRGAGRGSTAPARKEYAHARQAAAQVHTTRRAERPASGQRAPCRPRLSFRPSFLPAAKRTARGLFSRRRAAKPYCMHRAGGAYAAGPPRPALPIFYHCHLILEYCLF